MMMAHDSGEPPSGRIDDASLDAVRLALRAYLHDTEDTSMLQASLVRVSADARARNVLPEQLLVTLKELWNTLPEVRAMTDVGRQARLLQRVVTMCIRAYYNA